MLYLELVSRPLTQDWENAPSLPAALAERCGAKEAVALILMRAGGAIRFWLGFPDRLAEHAILECRHSGFGYRAGEIPSFRSGVRSVLRREMNTQVLPRAGQSAVLAALPRSAAPEPEQMEALLYALENVAEDSGAALFFRPSAGLHPAVAAELSKLVSPAEQSVSLELLRAPKLYDAVACAYSPDAASRRVLEGELAYALQLQSFPLAGGQSVSPALLDAPLPADGGRMQQLHGLFVPLEIQTLGKVLCGSEHYGLPINKDTLAGRILPLPAEDSSKGPLMKFGSRDGGTQVAILMKLMQKHILVLGSPGSGKGNLLALMAAQLHESHVPFLFVESAKEEMHSLAAVIPSLRLWRAEAGKFVWNIFAVPPGVTLGNYTASLQQVFRNVFRLDGPLEELFGTTMRQLYAKYGWTSLSKTGDAKAAPFGMDEFMREYERIIRESGYSEGRTKSDMLTAGMVRLRRLFDANQLVFDTDRSIPVNLFTEGSNVLQLSPLTTPAAKQMFMTMLLLSLAAYLRTFGHHNGDRPRLIIALDESHNLLRAQQSVNEGVYSFAEDVEALLLECRSLGCGFVICDQFSGNISEGISRMCATKLFLGPGSTNLRAFADEVGADENLLRHMHLLDPGEGLMSTANLPQPVFFRSICVIDELLRSSAGLDPAKMSNDWLLKNPQFVVETYRSCETCPARGTCSIRSKDKASQIADELWQATGKMLAQSEDLKDDADRIRAQSAVISLLAARLAGESRSVFHCAVTQYYRTYRRESRANTRISEQTLRQALEKAATQKGVRA